MKERYYKTCVHLTVSDLYDDKIEKKKSYRNKYYGSKLVEEVL